jgi:probable rRNA maturation factor
VPQAAGETAALGAEADSPGRSPAEIVEEDPRWRPVEGLTAQLTRAVEAAVRAAGRDPEQVGLSLALSNDAAVQELNSRYCALNKPTNVLSFPAAPFAFEPEGGAGAFLGDVILSFETIEREAAAEGKPFRDHATHLAIHGTLHLLGYTHENDSTAEDMERLEIEVLGTLGIPNPYEAGAPPELGEPAVLPV